MYVNLIVINVLSIAKFHWKFACESSFTQFRQRDRYPCFHRTFLVFIMLLVSARGGFSYRRGVRRNWWRGVSTSVPFPVPPLFYPFPSLPLPRPVASEEQREQCSPKLKLPPPLKCGRPTTNKTKCRPIVLTSTPYSYTRSGGYLWTESLPNAVPRVTFTSCPFL